MGVLVAAGAASYGITKWAHYRVDRAEKIRSCQHSLRLDDKGELIFWTLRCERCPYQEPARKEIEAEQERRRAAV